MLQTLCDAFFKPNGMGKIAHETNPSYVQIGFPNMARRQNQMSTCWDHHGLIKAVPTAEQMGGNEIQGQKWTTLSKQVLVFAIFWARPFSDSPPPNIQVKNSNTFPINRGWCSTCLISLNNNKKNLLQNHIEPSKTEFPFLSSEAFNSN